MPQTNSFQAAILTNGSASYAVFTYNCGLMDYSARAAIGFAAYYSYGIYANHPLSMSERAKEVACLNSPRSPWANVIYELSTDRSEGSDIDIGNGGDIEYEIHTYGPVLDSVSAFVSKDRGIDFNPKWMLLVYWNRVAPLNPASSHPVSEQVRLYVYAYGLAVHCV